MHVFYTDEENISLTRPYAKRARKLGIPVEVELGRLEGGEAGLRMISDAELTDPGKAEAFMKGTGAVILAPSIGNLHGSYLNPPNFQPCASASLPFLAQPEKPTDDKSDMVWRSELTIAPNTDLRLILVDIVEPTAPTGVESVAIKADLTDEGQVDGLFTSRLGMPDTVYCLHGIMSRGAEDNFDLGLKARTFELLALYGGPLPDVITPSTIATPESAYGLGKLASELFINEYTRRGFIDGRILRLPTIVVRPGPPSPATSAFISGIIREPLQGHETTCPIGESLDSSALDLPLWLASPETTIANLAHAKHILADQFPSHSRVVCLPGFTTTVRDEISALEKVAGKEALALLKFKDDPVNRRVVSSWPARFDNMYALGLGFNVDEGGMEPIIRRFQRDHLQEKSVVTPMQ
ncbi:hypothetical protein C0991_005593 [Blastosporella zonata]|nr:hypothetical protein C0991_005593 [Blastosporella zonata]